MDAMLKLSTGNVQPAVDGLQAALRTVRKIPIFKDVHDAALNFEWPSNEQLIAMPRGKSYSLRRLLWKPFQKDNSVGCLGLELWNGQKSPIFRGRGANLHNLKSFEFVMGRTVCKFEKRQG
jgi:hypothetical protein